MTRNKIKCADAQAGSAIRLVLPNNATLVMKHVAAVLARQVESRCGAKVTTPGKAPLTVELVIEPSARRAWRWHLPENWIRRC